VVFLATQGFEKKCKLGGCFEPGGDGARRAGVGLPRYPENVFFTGLGGSGPGGGWGGGGGLGGGVGFDGRRDVVEPPKVAFKRGVGKGGVSGDRSTEEGFRFAYLFCY